MVKKLKREPKGAFPYKPPSKEVLKTYAYIFKLKKPIPPSILKIIFDKLLASICLTLSLPIFLILKVAYVIEGFLIPENKGPLFFYYEAISQGKKFRKYKLRLIKIKHIDAQAAKRHDWVAYVAEWDPSKRTYVGEFIKQYYLDELPQFYSILKGDMSVVGPRPLAVVHYHRDLAQGNVARLLLRGGLFGLGHIHKGTSQMGEPRYEYEYIHEMLSRSSWGLLKLDMWIIWRGILLMAKGGGH